jgi:hypothetical protein
MSSGLGIDYAADHAEQELDREITIKFRGREISAIASIPEQTRQFEDDATGFYEAAVIRVSIRNSVIRSHGSTPVKAGEKILYDGSEYRIRAVTNDTQTAVTLCDCEGVAQ